MFLCTARTNEPSHTHTITNYTPHLKTTDTSTGTAIPPVKVLRLLPKAFRFRAVGAMLGSLTLAILSFVGVAVLIPLIMLALNEQNTLDNPVMQWLYTAGGFRTPATFICALCGAILLFVILKSLCAVVINNAINKFLLSVYRHYSTRMFDTYLSRGLLFIRNHHTSELINDINGVCVRFADGVLGQIFAISTDAILLILILAALLVYDPLLVLLAVAVFLPLTLAYLLIFRRRINENGRTENRLFVAQNKTLYETLRGYSDIKINNAERYVSDRFRNGLHNLTEHRRKAAMMRGYSSHIGELSMLLGVTIMIVAGVLTGRSTDSLAASLGVFAVAAYKIIPTVSSIAGSWMEYKRNSFAAVKLYETFSDTQSDPDFESSDNTKIPFDHDITLENITFGYDAASPVLRDFSLTIRKGERIGIRGYSGVGKTTLFNLLCGFMRPQSGTIRIDDNMLTPDNTRAWQNNLSYVSQDVFIPDVTIAENIAFGVAREEIDPVRLERVIRAASLTGLIESLPEGVDTVTGEAGCKLSGGQRQRIGIARALYKEASVMLFDEATSSLDSQTEREIVEAIETLSAQNEELTILIISHRENTLEFCNRIIEL